MVFGDMMQLLKGFDTCAVVYTIHVVHGLIDDKIDYVLANHMMPEGTIEHVRTV